MDSKHCVACGQSFRPRPQVPHQAYCSASSCQRTRKKQWQQNKLQVDPDYQENQDRAQKAWHQRNPGYYRQYRASHPDYAARNRSQQHTRNTKTKPSHIAKMDVSNRLDTLPSGLYQVRLVSGSVIAKMDVWIVELTLYDGD
jgi:hypothetical protein